MLGAAPLLYADGLAGDRHQQFFAREQALGDAARVRQGHRGDLVVAPVQITDVELLGLQMHELRQTASRASSTHYDMLTGEARPNRGYTFSSDEPRAASRDLQKRKSVKDRLMPDLFKKSLRKKDHRKRLTMINQEEDDAVEEQDDARLS